MASWQKSNSRNGNGSNGRGSYQRLSEEMLEQENNRLVDSLSSKVSTLRNVALDIQSEATSHNKYLSGLDDEMDSSKGLLGGSMQRLSHMVASNASNRKLMCYLILFLVGAFVIGYYALAKIKK